MILRLRSGLCCIVVEEYTCHPGLCEPIMSVNGGWGNLPRESLFSQEKKLNSNPKDGGFLPYMNMLIMDYFSAIS